jgi:adenylate cyclase
MFTDMVGFTRLGQRDEEGALRLRTEQQVLVRPIVAAHGGREVKSLGDGFLIEFASAVESVRCAAAIQEAVAARNADTASETPIQLRVGIHVGDVVEEGSDIVGDAVNVASRIEPLAEPGGVLVSSAVFEQVRGKVPFALERVGARRLKNVESPLELYRVAVRRSGAPARPPSDSGAPLRLAVLPFANLSPATDDDYFADGLTDEMISQVGRIPGLRVIARTSVWQYKGSPKSIREVGNDLGVSLALEGSVRKAGDRVRVTVQLVDTMTEEPSWSSRYDRPFDDIFRIQDEIAVQVASSVSGHLARQGGLAPSTFARSNPDTSNLVAYSHYLHARKLFGEKASEATLREALGFFEAAAQEDPGFARAHVGIAEALLWLGGEGALPYPASAARARQELTRALALQENLAEAHAVLAGLLISDDEIGRAVAEAHRALELNPSLTDPYRTLAQIAAGNGRMDESIRLLESAQRIDPLNIDVLAFLGRCYYYGGRTQRALEHWERTERYLPFRVNIHRIEHYLAIGDLEAAERSFAEAERQRPTSLWVEVFRAWIAVRRGRPEEAHRALERLEERRRAGSPAFYAGFAHYALGDTEAFVAALEDSFRGHQLPLLELMYSPLYADARKDPRVLELIRQQVALP